MKRELSLDRDEGVELSPFCDSLYCKDNNSSDVWNQKTKTVVIVFVSICFNGVVKF